MIRRSHQKRAQPHSRAFYHVKTAEQMFDASCRKSFSSGAVFSRPNKGLASSVQGPDVRKCARPCAAGVSVSGMGGDHQPSRFAEDVESADDQRVLTHLPRNKSGREQGHPALLD